MRAALALLLAAGCSRCGEPAEPQVSTRDGGTTSFGCVQGGDRVNSCEDVELAFAAKDKVVVRLCRLEPRGEPGESEQGRTRVELRRGKRSIGCVRLEDVSSLSAICNGPDEAACLSRVGADNLAQTRRFWAPRRFASSRLVVFFGDVLDSDVAAVEIVQIDRKARNVFHQKPGRPFVFSRLEDVDKDGVPELLGWQAPAELAECQPYLPQAIFSLGKEGYARNEALMEKWARGHGKPWHGPDPNPAIRVCDEDEEDPEPARPPVVVGPR